MTNLLREPERILQGGVNDRTPKTWHCKGTNHENGTNMSHANRNAETIRNVETRQRNVETRSRAPDV